MAQKCCAANGQNTRQIGIHFLHRQDGGKLMKHTHHPLLAALLLSSHPLPSSLLFPFSSYSLFPQFNGFSTMPTPLQFCQFQFQFQFFLSNLLVFTHTIHDATLMKCRCSVLYSIIINILVYSHIFRHNGSKTLFFVSGFVNGYLENFFPLCFMICCWRLRNSLSLSNIVP